MKIIEIKPKALNFKEYIKRSAKESDYKTLISEDALITTNGVPKILYMKLPVDSSKLRAVVKKLKYSTTKRIRGLATTSTIFGYNPRNAIRKDYCSATAMAYTQPKEHAFICEFGKVLSQLYKQYFPDVYNYHNSITDKKILPEWKINETPFTSGIVNKNNPLKYHFDTGNIKEALSNMVVFKKDVQGGYLACPEFGVGFECADDSVVIFDGQSILHGVTPIKQLFPDSYRYSIVYYTLQQLWSCEPLSEEILRVRKTHLAMERRRANGEVKESLLRELKSSTK